MSKMLSEIIGSEQKNTSKKIKGSDCDKPKRNRKSQQIKSKKRVREQGEVFTNQREVKSMCDLIPTDVWNNIDSTFLEPTCGNGNFLVEILERKLKLCKEPKDIARALKSIYAIDIMQDNVDESRKRLIELCSAKCVEFTADYSQIADVMVDCIEILQNNIICGDSLEIMKKGGING